MNKAQKQQYIENLDQMSKDYSAMFIASFSNMSVKEMIQFRTEIRNNEGVTKISKNNIVKIFIDKSEDKKVERKSSSNSRKGEVIMSSHCLKIKQNVSF